MYVCSGEIEHAHKLVICSYFVLVRTTKWSEEKNNKTVLFEVFENVKIQQKSQKNISGVQEF